MDKQSFALIVFTTVIVFSSSTMAGSGHGGKGRFMALFDTNNDDVVTTEEFKQAAADRFSKMDKDKSGAVDKDEFQSYLMEKRQKRSEMKFNRIDSNEDGAISEAEYLDYKQKRAQSRFQRMDKDGDGVVSPEEYKNNRRYGKWSGRHRKGGIFAKLDKNGDGQITQAESLAAWSAWFAKIDGNGDKVVTADEVKDYRNKNFDNKK